jgi:hypothetical protein
MLTWRLLALALSSYGLAYIKKNYWRITIIILSDDWLSAVAAW